MLKRLSRAIKRELKKQKVDKFKQEFKDIVVTEFPATTVMTKEMDCDTSLCSTISKQDFYNIEVKRLKSNTNLENIRLHAAQHLTPNQLKHWDETLLLIPKSN